MNRDTIVPHVVRVTLFMSICRVTPSRVCELKFISFKLVAKFYKVTPSRVCELKSHPYLLRVISLLVTPSRVCELKLAYSLTWIQNIRHTLTGV